MQIAILGWGSLYWNLGALATDGNWQSDGPWLPIEFARLSSQHRLTLVLFANAGLIRTYWIKSARTELNAACENLGQRESCKQADIGFLTQNGASHIHPLPGLEQRIREWLVGKPHLEAVIWTDLRSNFRKRRNREFSTQDALDYLQELIVQGEHAAAEQYIRRAPPQTDTCLRRRARELLGWTDR